VDEFGWRTGKSFGKKCCWQNGRGRIEWAFHSMICILRGFAFCGTVEVLSCLLVVLCIIGMFLHQFVHLGDPGVETCFGCFITEAITAVSILSLILQFLAQAWRLVSMRDSSCRCRGSSSNGQSDILFHKE
jgi:hypothetical protein